MTGLSNSFTPAADLSVELRQAFGRFGTGVTVITAQSSFGPLGMTANSFSSISLDPALVLWAPALRSQRHDAFVSASHFCIHVLAADQIEMARHFASNGTGFDAFDWQDGPLGAPRLDGCLAEFHCDTFAVYPAGDHSLVLGEVRHVIQHEREMPGLLFEKGAFGKFSPMDEAP